MNLNNEVNIYENEKRVAYNNFYKEGGGEYLAHQCD